MSEKIAIANKKRKSSSDDVKKSPDKKKKAENKNDGSSTASSFPGKISKVLTMAQLTQEAQARGLDLGNVKHDKAFMLNLLGEGSVSVIAVRNKAAKEEEASKKTKNGSGKKNPATSKNTKTIKAPSGVGKSKAKTATETIQKSAENAIQTTSPAKPKKKVTTAKNSKATTTIAKGEAKMSEPGVSSNAILPKPIATTSSVAVPAAAMLKSFETTPKAKPVVSTTNKKLSDIALTKKMPSKTTPDVPYSDKDAGVEVVVVSSSSSSEPKTSSTTTTSAASFPRISDKLTLAQLKEEVIARKIDPQTAPKLKSDLLHFLVDGSIHVQETDTYKEYTRLLETLNNELPVLFQSSLRKYQATEARREEQQYQRYVQQAQKKRELKEQQAQKDREQQEQQEKQRQVEKIDQKHLHHHSFPLVHCHPLAETKLLLTHGKHRISTCDLCNYGDGLYTCEECDFDVCKYCFTEKNMTVEQKQRERQQQRERMRQHEMEAEKREMEEAKRWDAKQNFTTSIIVPPAKHKNPSKPMSFTVYCSDGYDNDGWHSYDGPPTKEFDTTWETKKEANDRARFLFFWKNPWGQNPNEVGDENASEKRPKEKDGMYQWTVCPPDSSRWTVAVVPSAAYPHLENSSLVRHNFDDEDDSKLKGYGNDCYSEIAY